MSMTEGVTVIGAVASFLWGVISSIAGAVFWLLLATLVLACIAAIVRPRSVVESAPQSKMSVEAMKEALRSGELDAEIARVDVRNQKRRRA